MMHMCGLLDIAFGLILVVIKEHQRILFPTVSSKRTYYLDTCMRQANSHAS